MSDDAVMQAVSAIRAAARGGQTVELDMAIDRLIMLVAKAQARANQLQAEIDQKRIYERDRKRDYRLSRDKTGQDGTIGTGRDTPSPSPPMINNSSTPPIPTPKLSIKPTENPLFEEFWKVYPRKVGKGEARKAWGNAVKRAAPEDILAGAKRYAASKPDPEFTKHPGPWLNADRWLDETAKVVDFSGPKRSWAEIKAEKEQSK